MATLAAALAVAALGFVVPTAHAEDALISQGKAVTASSVENSGTPASAAVDGNTGTRWSSQFSDPQWIRVDLGGSATISQ
ncbi:MAG: discoidin domain-containing protein, partial [Actinomycetes bacterium]